MNILKPIEFILLAVFNLSYKLTNNYGLSLIIMSIVITLGTYPLYYLADIWKKKETDIQDAMADDINKIKAVYTGQKRFYLIQTTYRLFHYKSWYAFRTSLGLLIQIPFFFAAYNVLSAYTGYAGYSFLFIKDLSQPDGLIAGVNFMPILMTIINLVSSVIYSRSFKIKDNLQLTILALLFLIFLYNSPAALLIYWTNNNILSLIKSFWLNKSKKLQMPSKNELSSYKFLLKIAFIWSLLVCQLYSVSRSHSARYILLANCIVVFFIFIISFIYHKNLSFLGKHYLSLIILLFFAIDYVLKFNLPFLNTSYLAPLVILIETHWIYYCFITNATERNILSLSISKKSLFISIIFVFSTLFLLLPLLLFFQNSEDISDTFLSVCGIDFLITGIILIILFFLIKWGKEIVHVKIAVCIIGIISFYFLNSICFSLDSGVISGFSISNANKFTQIEFPYVVLDIVLGIFVFICIYLILTKNQKIIQLMSILFFSFTFIQFFFIGVKNKDTIFCSKEKLEKNKVYELNPSVYRKHSFSKNKVNVVYIVADMFNSEYMELLRNDIPDIEKRLEGFTWYKDTLSVSGWTNTSIPALYAGGDFAPLKNIENRISVYKAESDAIFLATETYKKAGFNFSFVSDIGVEGKIPPYYYKYCLDNSIPIDSNISKKKLLFMLPFFNLSPIVMKKYFYNDSQWLIYGKQLAIDFNRINAIKSLSYLSLLPYISNADSEQSNFLYFRTELSHSPYGIDKNGNVIINDYPDTELKSFESSAAAYYSAKKTMELLLDYIDWLKQNNVFNNTIIVICSDHGNSCFDNHIPVENNNEKLWKSRANALFLYKPLNSFAPFFEDDETKKSNGDIAAMIADELGIKHSYTYHTQEDGKRIYCFMKSIAELRDEKIDMDYAIYEVDGNMYDAKSWNQIE